MGTTANKEFLLMLRAAYHYYWLDDPIMEDWEYDYLTKQVANNEENITSKHKKLVDFKSLKTCSSLYYIPRKKLAKIDYR